MNSKELLERTGISRATLNNYIALGIVPRPEVLPPEPDDGAAPRIGYFPADTVQRIAEIQRLKQEGWSMSRIAAHFGAAPPHPGAAGAGTEPAGLAAATPPPTPVAPMPRLSLDDMAYPAYLVDRRFELAWFNPQSVGVLGPAAPGDNVLRLLLTRPSPAGPADEPVLQLHLRVARAHGVPVSALGRGLPEEARMLLERLEQEAAPAASPAPVSHVLGRGPTSAGVCVYAIEFREGILFVHAPAGAAAEELAARLQAQAAADSGRPPWPVLSDLAVVVMDLQQAPQVWSQLPAEEYFELINQIWVAAEPIFRRHRATQGKHPRDGMACYFLRERDGNYLWNALLTAHEMRQAMRRINLDWQQRKGWATELSLNIGIDEGQQWLGVLQPRAPAEFTMFGEVLNRAAAISEVARDGAVWATRNLLAKLSPPQRRRLTWGVHRLDREGQAHLVPAVFTAAERLAGAPPAAEGAREIAYLPITQILDIAGTERADRAGERQPN